MCADWTTEEELARLIRARAARGRMVTLRPETAERIARRLLTPTGADRHLTGLGFRLEVWSPDGRGFLELLAAAQSYQLIKLVFDAALKTRPGGRLVVRQGIRVVLDSGPPDPGGAGNVVRLPTAGTVRTR
jgi:hypothetical protein